MGSSRAFAGASATTDHEHVEWYLRALGAPIIDFLEEASKLDDGYPDRYEGPRNGPFDPEKYRPHPFNERSGYTLQPALVVFSVHDGKGNGRNLRIETYMKGYQEVHGDPTDVSMDIILYENGMVEFQGGFHNLPNPPQRGPHLFAGDAYVSYGVWRAMTAIIDTYMFYSHVPERVALLSKLAGETFIQYYNKNGPTADHPLGLSHPFLPSSLLHAELFPD